MTTLMADGDRRIRPRSDGTVDVTCWCEARTVAVSPADVRAGRTMPCGRAGCAAGCDPIPVRAKPGPKGPWKHKREAVA